jgi:hypothetical protein
MIEHQSGTGTFVCARCLDDEALQQFAREHGKIRECDYCREKPTTSCVVPLDDVTDFMGKAIAEEWCDPAETSPVDHGEYLVKTIDADDLFYSIGFEVSNDELMQDITDSFSDHDWCERDWQLLSPSKRWAYGWKRFRHLVKHERRYTFWYSKDDIEDESHPDYLPAAYMLDELGTAIHSANLVKSCPAGTVFWRLQSHSNIESLSAPERFTSPPIDCATQPNRMSPPGVPMFYGADEFDTALLELVDPTDTELASKLVSGVQFKNIVPFSFLDLTSIQSVPSYFSADGPYRRHIVRFIRDFAADLCQPIVRDGRQHIEYVPTQVFTEYVRHVMKGPEGARVHGIRYSSSKNGRPCYVVFATQAECLAPPGPLDFTTQKLEFVPGSLKTVKAETARIAGKFQAEFEKAISEISKKR